jgi:NitT/TauT family transport system ATP-binding protein
MADALTFHNVTKRFTDTGKPFTALERVTLSIEQGEFFIFVGPSGSGKSTLLRLASGLDQEYSGTIALGPGLTPQDMSFVFQQFALLPWLSVIRNVELGLIARNMLEPERRKRAEEVLKRLGLEQSAHAQIHELSGGMRQRVGIARALVTKPKIIFMDEPFSELDSFTAEDLRQDLLTIWHEERPTIVMVTHIVAEAIELADRIAVLSSRPGCIEAIVPNTIPRPRQLRSQAAYALEDKLKELIKP